MKKVIISGASGFIGSALTRYLAASNVDVVALVRDSSNARGIATLSHVEVFDFNLSEAHRALESIPANDYDVFYHLAWDGSAGTQRTDVKLQLDNAKWITDCLVLAKQLGCKRFVSSGSIVEHETVAAVYTQGNKPGLGYIYGGGKLIAHTMCAPVAANIGIDLVWAEITNAYGPGELSPRLINTTLRKCLAKINPQFTAGTQNYDFVYIDDVARAFCLIGKNGKPFHSYCIGSATARPLKEFLLTIQAEVAPNLKFIFGDVPFTGVNLPLSAFDTSLTEADTGFKAEIAFAEGIRRTYEWCKQGSENHEQL